MGRSIRVIFLLLFAISLFGCTSLGGPALARKDLSKIVLQQSDVPEEYSNLTVFAREAAKSFFPQDAEDRDQAFHGVSYLYPKDGLNYIYSLVVVYDDETSAKNVYARITEPVKPELHLLNDAIGDESLLYSTPSGTSLFSVWRYKEAVCYLAIVTRLTSTFGYDEIVDASNKVQSRLEE